MSHWACGNLFRCFWSIIMGSVNIMNKKEFLLDSFIPIQNVE